MTDSQGAPPLPPKDTKIFGQVSAQNSASPSGASTPEANPEVDYVLVFEAVPKKYLKPGKVPTTEKNAIAAEYQKLVDSITRVGLQVTSRQGKPGSGHVLLFVRAHDDALLKVGKEEK